MANIPIPFLATITLPPSTTPVRAFFRPPPVPTSPADRISGYRRTRIGLTVVTRAGLSANSYVLAFMLPFSLLAATIFTAVRIDEQLEQKYLEELEINQAIMEAGEEDDDDDGDEEGGDCDEEVNISLEESHSVHSPTRTRNRPIREA